MRSKFWRGVIKYAQIAINAISLILRSLGKDEDQKKIEPPKN